MPPFSSVPISTPACDFLFFGPILRWLSRCAATPLLWWGTVWGCLLVVGTGRVSLLAQDANPPNVVAAEALEGPVTDAAPDAVEAGPASESDVDRESRNSQPTEGVTTPTENVGTLESTEAADAANVPVENAAENELDPPPIVPGGEAVAETSVEGIPPPPPLPAIVDPASLLPTRNLLSTEGTLGPDWLYCPGRTDAAVELTWLVVEAGQGRELRCTGEPQGYIRTVAHYRDFDFGLEWKYPSDENGNSGILVYTAGEDRVWPTAVQVQLHQPKTGSVFGSGEAQVDPEIDTKNHFSRPVGEWNELLVSSRNGVLSVTINGRPVGEVSVRNPADGAIGLQSEGSEIHFRNIWLRGTAVEATTIAAIPARREYSPPSVLIPRAYHCQPAISLWSAEPVRMKPRIERREQQELVHVPRRVAVDTRAVEPDTRRDPDRTGDAGFLPDPGRDRRDLSDGRHRRSRR
jgi:hypothetical protein